MSKATAYRRQVAEDRQDWKLAVFPFCWWCRRWESALVYPERLEINEILPRSSAPNRWWHRCNASLVCTTCHGKYGHGAKDVQWLARKWLYDLTHYDLERWLVMRNMNAMNYITQVEVEREALKIKEKN